MAVCVPAGESVWEGRVPGPRGMCVCVHVRAGAWVTLCMGHVPLRAKCEQVEGCVYA